MVIVDVGVEDTGCWIGGRTLVILILGWFPCRETHAPAFAAASCCRPNGARVRVFAAFCGFLLGQVLIAF